MSSDFLSPDRSPTVATGVRRLNKIPIYIIGGVLVFMLIILGFIVSDKGRNQAQTEDPDTTVRQTGSNYARDMTQGRTGGVIEAAKPPVAPPTLPTLTEKPNIIDSPATQEAFAPTMPPAMPMLPEEPDPEAEAIRSLKMQMLQQSALASSALAYKGSSSGSGAGAPSSNKFSLNAASGTPRTREEMLNRIQSIRAEISQTQSTDPTQAYMDSLAQAQQIAQQITGGSGGAATTATQNTGAPSEPQSSNPYNQFAGNTTKDRWRLGNNIEFPRTPFEVRAGTVIPGILIGGVNSDIPGYILGQVSQDVYDTATGRNLLIPQGTKLFGEYSSDVQYGQSRVLVAWQRLTFPDGKVLDIGAMPGADQEGYSGYKDKVNNHYVRLFGSAILMSAVTAGIALSQDDNDGGSGLTDRRRASDAMSEAMGQQLGTVTAQLLSKNLSVAPTLEIRPGYRFNIIATKDLTFYTPYKSFDYNAWR